MLSCFLSRKFAFSFFTHSTPSFVSIIVDKRREERWSEDFNTEPPLKSSKKTSRSRPSQRTLKRFTSACGPSSGRPRPRPRRLADPTVFRCNCCVDGNVFNTPKRGRSPSSSSRSKTSATTKKDFIVVDIPPRENGAAFWKKHRAKIWTVYDGRCTTRKNYSIKEPCRKTRPRRRRRRRRRRQRRREKRARRRTRLRRIRCWMNWVVNRRDRTLRLLTFRSRKVSIRTIT